MKESVLSDGKSLDDSFDVKTDTKQGCVTAPVLFVFYSPSMHLVIRKLELNFAQLVSFQPLALQSKNTYTRDDVDRLYPSSLIRDVNYYPYEALAESIDRSSLTRKAFGQSTLKESK